MTWTAAVQGGSDSGGAERSADLPPQASAGIGVTMPIDALPRLTSNVAQRRWLWYAPPVCASVRACAPRQPILPHRRSSDMRTALSGTHRAVPLLAHRLGAMTARPWRAGPAPLAVAKVTGHCCGPPLPRACVRGVYTPGWPKFPGNAAGMLKPGGNCIGAYSGGTGGGMLCCGAFAILRPCEPAARTTHGAHKYER
jgi:hypothetical protein